jgi:hypothetical protein
MRPLLALALAACFNPSYGDQTRCGAADECPPGRACMNGFCRAGGAPDASGGPAALNITKTGGGTGTFTFAPAGGSTTACDASCPGAIVQLDPGTQVMLTAAPVPGAYFLGFGGPCPGPARQCTVTVTQPVALSPRFEAIDHNLMFVTATSFTGDFGSASGASAGDVLCQLAATRAGLAGSFVAVLGATGRDPGSVLVRSGGGAARGFIRLDGQPIADTVTDLLVSHRVWYPVAFDENGNAAAILAWYGAGPDGHTGDTSATCSGWATKTGQAYATHSGGNFASPFGIDCGESHPLVCAAVDRDSAVSAPAPSSGKRIFVTKGAWAPATGVPAAATLCSNEVGLGRQAAVLLPRDHVPASSWLVPGQLYVRPDGVPVGVGADLVAGQLGAGVWVHGDGDYAADVGVWTGTSDITHPAGAESCMTWSNAFGTGYIGAMVTGPYWWAASNESCCIAHPVYCVEQ